MGCESRDGVGSLDGLTLPKNLDVVSPLADTEEVGGPLAQASRDGSWRGNDASKRMSTRDQPRISIRWRNKIAQNWLTRGRSNGEVEEVIDKEGCIRQPEEKVTLHPITRGPRTMEV